MKRFLFSMLALAVSLGVFTACQEDAPEINYTMNVSVTNDFTKVVEAINAGAIKNEEAIAKLVQATDQMRADQVGKLAALIDAVTSMENTLDTRLAAVEAALKAQTLSLESKLDVLRKAIENGTLKAEELAGKLTTAIDNLGGELSAKMDEISGVISSQTTALGEKLAAVEAALKAQTLSLESKLDVLRKAIESGTLKTEELAGKLTTAIDNLGGELSAKMNEIKGVISSQTTTLGEKLAAVESAMKAQTLSLEDKLDIIEKAIKALPDYSAKLEAIEKAITALPDYSEKLDAIEKAIKALPNYSNKFDAVTKALNDVVTEIKNMEKLQSDVAGAIGKVQAELGNLVKAVGTQDDNMTKALAEIVKRLEELKAAIGSGGGAPTPTVKAIDLGLSVLWAECNLGAAMPHEYGNYYAWAETSPKAEYSVGTYKHMESPASETNYNKYTVDDGVSGAWWYGSGSIDNQTVILSEDDPATQLLGAPWRMPTLTELNELINQCVSWEQKKYNGIEGKEWKGPNGNTIFFPFSGFKLDAELYNAGTNPGSIIIGGGAAYCWSSNLSQNNTKWAFSMSFQGGTSTTIDANVQTSLRYYGMPVRPVRDK